jgi:hypothetical protein
LEYAIRCNEVWIHLFGNIDELENEIMKRYVAFFLMSLALIASPAENPRDVLLERQIAYCKVWTGQIDRRIGAMNRTGTMSVADAAAAGSVVDLPGIRCESSRRDGSPTF